MILYDPFLKWHLLSLLNICLLVLTCSLNAVLIYESHVWFYDPLFLCHNNLVIITVILIAFYYYGSIIVIQLTKQNFNLQINHRCSSFN